MNRHSTPADQRGTVLQKSSYCRLSFHAVFTDGGLWLIQLLMNIPLARAPIAGFSLSGIYQAMCGSAASRLAHQRRMAAYGSLLDGSEVTRPTQRFSIWTPKASETATCSFSVLAT